MFSEGINHGVGLIICRVGGIVVVVVKIDQPAIVMLFKPFILILRRVSGSVDNGPLLGDALKLFTMMFHTEHTKCRSHDHGVRDRVDAKMPRSVVVSLARVEIHISACDAGSVYTVDNLLDEFHLLICCFGCRVDLGSDLV